MKRSWLCACMVAFSSAAPGQTTPAAAGAAGTWKPLSDGRSFTGWEQTSPGWRIENGAFVCDAKWSFLRTAAKFTNFELELEWRMKPNANGGVFFALGNDDQEMGPQMQLTDPRVAGLTQSGGLDGVLSPSRDASKPLGSWNRARLVVKGTYREHWINNVKVLAYDLDSAEYKAALKTARNKNWPALGKAQEGAIALQCWHETAEPTEVAYRNIRIRELPDAR